MSQLKFIPTADGSKTLFHSGLGEHYHSVNGAVQESRHVFLESGLQYFLKETGFSTASVLEVGFGTGLNFLLTAQYCFDNRIHLEYTGVEPFPLAPQAIHKTGYDGYVRPETWQPFVSGYEKCSWEKKLFPGSVQLEIIRLPAQDLEMTKRFDVLYFDAFSVAAQPELWTRQTLERICSFMKAGGVFVTYAANGNLKRHLTALGFRLEKLPGASGKREMLRAIRLPFSHSL